MTKEYCLFKIGRQLQRITIFVGMILLLGVGFCLAQTEEKITLTTYYPSPHGEYGELDVDRDLSNNSDTITGLSVDIDESGTNAGTVTGLNVDVSGVTSGTRYSATFQGGNVGIGTATPGNNLEVYSTGSTIASIYGSDDNRSGVNVGGGQLNKWFMFQRAADNDRAFRIQENHTDPAIGGEISSPLTILPTSGNVGLEVNTPTFKLDVAQGSQARIADAEIGDWPYLNTYAYFGHQALDHAVAGNYALLQDSAGSTYLNAAAGHNIYFRINNSNCMTLDSNGRLGIGTTAPNTTLHVNGNTRLGNRPTGGTLYLTVQTGGLLCYVTSSQRYKKDIRDLEVADPEAILRLRPVRFRCRKTDKEGVGLIAEEVDKLIKDLVIYEEEKPESVKFEKISLYLLFLLRELKEENLALQERVKGIGNNFKQRVEDLKLKNKTQQAQIESLVQRVTALE